MIAIEKLQDEKGVTPMPVNRLGQFKLSSELLRSGLGWPALLPLFARMVVIRAEFIFASDVIEYTAQSDLFEVSPDHCVPPEYDIIFTKKDGGTLEICAKKMLTIDFRMPSKNGTV
jgi:hypothetical protein